jgi:filamentous hemagglutinin family protein
MKSHRHVSGVSVVFCLAMAAIHAFANPVGESLRAGRARFDRAGPGALSIHQQSDRLIINWREFSIAAGETTRFIQPSATSIALNRVVTANPSRLFGNLEANGKVYLINPNGILVGRGGAVNTRGFVASTLDVSDASFLSGATLRLSGDSEASVVNEGSIQAIGGDVFLVGRTVENSGTIRGSAVGLGAGSEVMIVPTGRERLSVIAGNPNGGRAEKGVNNEGTIEAVSAELKAAGGNIYALAVNNGGVIRATGVRREGGRVFLSSDGGNIENSGTIVANNANGGGGFVSLAGGRNAESPATVINSGAIEARGDAVGTRGGEVRLTGDYVGLFGASLIDVSGHSGGGTALIGGDYQGGNPTVQNAQRTFVDRDSRINADALALGNGGKVIVWSDDVTRYYGSLSARGGSGGGDGGFAEVSGKEFLSFHGSADLGAAHGANGSILLDPRDLTVQAVGADDGIVTATGLAFTDPDTTTDVTISAAVIEALTGNITLEAHRDLTIDAALNLANQTSGESVIFRAGDDLDINATVVTGGASLSFFASDSGGANVADAVLTIDAAVGDVTTGDISFINDGTAGIDVNANVVSSGTVTFDNNNGDVTRAGAVSVTASTLNLTGDGNVGTSGARLNTDVGAITLAKTGGNTFVSESGAVNVSGATGGGNLNLLAGGAVSINAALDAGAGSVTLNATAGGVNQTAGSGITANTLILLGTGTFDLTDALNDINNLTADVTGPVTYRDADDLTIANGVASANNAIDIATVIGTLTVNNDINGPDVDAGTSTVRLTAGNSVNGGDSLHVSGGIQGTAGITLVADRMLLTLVSPGTITAGAGDVLLRPFNNGTLVNLGGADAAGVLGLTDVELDDVIAGTLTIGDANTGTITVSADLTQGTKDINLITGGDIAFENGDRLAITGDAVLTAGGAINNAGGGANVVAETLSATAQSGIDLDTTITTLILADVLGTGAIDISDTAGGLAVTTATTANGDITLNATGGDLSVTTVTANGSGSDVELTTTTSGDVTVGAVTATGDSVTITSDGAVLDGNGASVNIVADSLSATAGLGIDLDTDIATLTLATAGGAGNIDINDLMGDLAVGVVTATGNDVTLVSAGAVTDANGSAANVAAGTLSVTAQAGIDLDTTITTLTLADVLGIGAINISDTAGGLIVATATTFDGNITLNATGGALDTTTVTAGGASDIQLTTTTSGNVSVGTVTALDDTVTINSAGTIIDGNGAAENVLAGDLSATAQTGIDLDTTIGTLTLASVLGTGAINISDTAGGLIVTTATTSDGNITLSATSGNLDVTSANAGGTGDIQLTTTTSGDVNVGTVSATGDNVTITSAGGITDANGAAVNVVASTLSATAQTGIDLDTTIGTLTLASVLAAGNIGIADTDGLIVTAATTFDGNITLSATGGTLDVGTVTAGGAGDVQLTTTTSGNVNLGTVTAAGDTVTINSAGGVTDGNAAAVNVVADSVSVTAASFGAAGNAIETDVNAVSVNTSGAVNTSADDGDQFITEANGLTALELNAGVGDVNLTLTLGAVTDADAATDITAGDLTVILSDAAAQSFGVSGQEIRTSVATLSVDTSAGDGSQFIREVNALTGLNLNADGGSVNLAVGGALTDTDTVTDIDASGISVATTGSGAIGSIADPIEIDAGPGAVLLQALGTGGGVHVELAQAGNVTITDSQSYLGTTAVETLFNQVLASVFQVRYANDLTIQVNGNINSTIAAGNFLRVPGQLSLNASGSIGGGIANPMAIDAGTLHASAGTGLSFTDVNDVTLGDISSAGGMFFVEAANTLTFSDSTMIDAGAANTAFLVANGSPGVRVVGTVAPNMISRFILYALNSELTDPPTIIDNNGFPSIGLLDADRIDSPRNFNPATPDPFGDLLSYFVFSLVADPPTDPSLFIDVPVEVFQPVSIVFGEYDPTKFGEVGDLWMSSSELYEIERKAGKARKALPTQVNRTKYVPENGK